MAVTAQGAFTALYYNKRQPGSQGAPPPSSHSIGCVSRSLLLQDRPALRELSRLGCNGAGRLRRVALQYKAA